VQGEREHEDRKEGYAQGVLVDLERQTPPPDWPGSGGAVLTVIGVRVLRIRVFRLGRTPLVEKGGQHHVGAHLEELALPVLEDRLDEVAAPQVLDVADGRPSVLHLGAVIVE
jgi:hypothetical protein